MRFLTVALLALCALCVDLGYTIGQSTVTEESTVVRGRNFGVGTVASDMKPIPMMPVITSARISSADLPDFSREDPGSSFGPPVWRNTRSNRYVDTPMYELAGFLITRRPPDNRLEWVAAINYDGSVDIADGYTCEDALRVWASVE